ncbi:FAD-dependent oxidoreductase [Ponticaulis profundi]|uniref:FAD-dependent oxidoreductase n=1 Tax=Ponticaulis profundi TaxID=2665222 RepID=A0ABW1S856_9PROT
MSDEFHFPVIVVGAGGAGLCAALAARDLGADVLVLERDAVPMGSTAMSTGLIPAAGTPEQAEQGIDDSPERFASDVMAKTKGKADESIALKLGQESAETISWLRDKHNIPLSLIGGFLYPGHTAMRMYGTPHRTGGELMGSLQEACEASDVIILTEATVTRLLHDDKTITGVEFSRPDGSVETATCDAVILACCGFGGDADMVAQWIPEMAAATYHGHPGNKGDAIRWGEELGAKLEDMSAYQGHGGLAAGHGIPILWPLIMEGGFQVNRNGERFSNEASGYSEQAAKVNAQPGHAAWSIFDQRLHDLMLAFDDYQDALKAGAVQSADTIEELAEKANLPADALKQTLADVEEMVIGTRHDEFGRDFTGKPPLKGPFYVAKVVGALFHTQGGLAVDGDARVMAQDGTPFPNLFAAGGAARGISGDGADGYMAGNGLLTATSLGKLAGRAAAGQL